MQPRRVFSGPGVARRLEHRSVELRQARGGQECAALCGVGWETVRASPHVEYEFGVGARGWVALEQQRPYHSSSFSGRASPLASTSPHSGGLHANARWVFHRPHTSHGKSTSSALLDKETKAMVSAKSAWMSREDLGPQPAPGPDDIFAIPTLTVASPPMSPLSRNEFKAQYIISPAKLHDHLKEARTPTVASPAPLPEPGLRSPRLESSRRRSNTTTTSMTAATTTTGTTGSARSKFSNRSADAPSPVRSLNPPRRNHNSSLPVMTSG